MMAPFHTVVEISYGRNENDRVTEKIPMPKS